MKIKAVIAVVLLSVGLFAQAPPKDREGQHQHQTQTVNSHNTNVNSHNNTATGGNASNSTAMTVGVGVAENTSIPRQSPPAFAPDAYPSAPCRVSASAGGSSPYFGLAIGGSKLDKDCAKRELARLLLVAGQRQAAVDALCSTQAAKGIANCNVLEQGAPPMPTVAPEPQQISISVEPIEFRFEPLRVEPIAAVTVLPPALAPVHVIVEPTQHKRHHKTCPTKE